MKWFAELSANWVGVLLVSSELRELPINAHRIAVMAEGRVTRELHNGPDLTKREVVRHAFPD
jgi:ABC-type sugar transport system ATPase subunit